MNGKPPHLRPIGPVLAFLLTCGGCGSSSEGPDELAGVWRVDFGDTAGVLRFREGGVYAYCYGDNTGIGGYELDGDDVTLRVVLKPEYGPIDLSGALNRVSEARMHLELYRKARETGFSRLTFDRYTGDCSEVEGTP